METITIKLGERTIEGALPASYAVRHEVVATGGQNVQRAFAAALGVCCPRVERMVSAQRPTKLSYEACNYQPLRYGGELIDALVGAGVPLAQVLEAGAECFRRMAETLITEAEVTAATGNSEPPMGG